MVNIVFYFYIQVLLIQELGRFLQASSHPRNINAPSCYKRGSTRAAQVLSNNFDSKTINNNYIQTWGNFLTENRLGLLPPKILKSFNTDCKSGDRSILNSRLDNGCFLREGVSKLINSNDNFFELLLKYDKI